MLFLTGLYADIINLIKTKKINRYNGIPNYDKYILIYCFLSDNILNLKIIMTY